MRSGKSIAALAVLLALLTGCGHQDAEGRGVSGSRGALAASGADGGSAIASAAGDAGNEKTAGEAGYQRAGRNEGGNGQLRAPPFDEAPPSRPTGAPQTAEVPKAAQSATPSATQNSQTANVQPSEMSPIGQLSTRQRQLEYRRSPRHFRRRSIPRRMD